MHADLRASDADRQTAADQLATHTAVGRLTLDEFDDRVRAVRAAQTHADLHRLLADLQAPEPAAQVPVMRAPRLGLVAIVLAVLVAAAGFAMPALAGELCAGRM